MPAPQAVIGILRKKETIFDFRCQKPQHSLCLSLVLFEHFLGSVQPQDAEHLQQEWNTTTLSEFRGPN